MKTSTTKRLLRWSCLLTLVGLALCLWSLVDPAPIPVIIAMTLAQVIGTLAFGLYLVVLFFDLRLSRQLPVALSRREEPPKEDA